MPKPVVGRPWRWIFLAAAVGLVSLRLLDPGLVRLVRLQAFDFLQRSAAPSEPAPQVTVVDVDERAIAAHGQWPWPRATLAELVERLADAGYDAVVFDIMLPDVDRHAAAVDERLRSGDDALVAAMHRVPVVLGFAARAAGPAVGPVAGGPTILAERPAVRSLASYPSSVRNLPNFEAAAAGIGHLHLITELDGVARRLPAVILVGTRLQPALAFEALRALDGSGSYLLMRGSVPGDLRMVVGERSVPLGRDGGLWIAWCGTAKWPRVSATAFLGSVDMPLAAPGSVAVVGVTAAGIADRWTTPVGVLPGVLVQAQAIDNLVTGRFAERPALVHWGEIAFVALLCGFAAWFAADAGRGLWIVGAGLGAMIGSAMAFSLAGVLLDPTYPLFACATVLALRLTMERNEARSAERVASARLAQAVESVPLGFVLFDRSDRMILANRRAAQIAGFDDGNGPAGMLIGAFKAQVAGSEANAAAMPVALAAAAESARGVSYELATPRAGQLLAVEKRLPNGCTALLYTDIAQIKERQRQLEELKEKAEESNRLKSQFLANISHELRTPLNAIIGFSEILEREMFGPIGHERYREYAGDILDSGRYLLSIVQDLLDLSAFEAGRFADEPREWIEVEDVVQAVMRLVGDQAGRAGIALRMDVPGDLMVQGNDRLLRQILVNLISNALKFTPADGTILVSAERRVDGAVALTVGDSGMGMAPDTVALATKPFWRGEDPFLRNHAGAGLGLALVKSFVAAQGAALEIDSAPEQGTRVSVVFPPGADGRGGAPPAGVVADSEPDARRGDRFVSAR